MRQFLAFDLPDAVRRRLETLQSDLRKELSGWRWTRPGSIHLTLRFLGEVDVEVDRRARQAWRDCAARVQAFSFRLSGLGCFPGPRRPRVLWVGIDADPADGSRLSRLAANLEEAARGVGFAAESRPFRPHLTLGRGARACRPQAPHEPAYVGDRVDATELVLFRSELQAGGARYTAIDSFPLGTDPVEFGR